MDTAQLPDFLILPDGEREKEIARQNNLRQEFNSRAQLSGIATERARAMIIEASLRPLLKKQVDVNEKDRISDQLAESLSAQGRFLEATRRAKNADIKAFCKQAAHAIFKGRECTCSPPIEWVGDQHLRLPKYRVIKEVYSLKHGQYGFLCECNKCQNWAFLGTNPVPQVEKVSDIEVLRA